MTGQGDVFGGGRVFRGVGYAAPPGTGPAGETCRTCAHMTGRRFHKCRLGLVTSGAATDIRTSAPACRLWTEVGTTLCQACRFQCSWNGQGPGCSHPTINGLLPVGLPPCRGKLFLRAPDITVRDGQVMVDGRPLGEGA